MRASAVIVLLVAPALVAAGFAGCTDGTTAVCDDAGTCLIGIAPDGSIVVDGSIPPDGSTSEAAGPTPDGGSGVDADAAGGPGDAGGAGDAGDASDGMAAGGD
jgi:hypothetical protein